MVTKKKPAAAPRRSASAGAPAAAHRADGAGDGGQDGARRTVERVQTGVRLERRVLGVLRAVADMHDLTLGDLLEGIVLHAFEGRAPFGPASLAKIHALRDVFGLDLRAEDSHLLVERGAGAKRRER